MVLKSTGSGCAALVNEVNRANANRENKGTRFFIKYSLFMEYQNYDSNLKEFWPKTKEMRGNSLFRAGSGNIPIQIVSSVQIYQFFITNFLFS